MSLGTRLKMLRNRKNLSQQELATRLGLKRVTYSQYEMDRRLPTYETLQKLSEFHGVSVDYIMGNTDNPDNIELNDVFHEGQLLWKGEPLSEEQLKPIADLLDMIIKERIPKYLEKKKKEEEEKKRGEGS